MATAVYITIDTECTEERLVRGRIRPPVGYDLMMWGRFANQRHALGLEWIAAALGRHRFPATFFVEALCSEVFGVQGLTEVCAFLDNAGQDIQLHLHPNLRKPAWRADGGSPLCDNIGEYAVAEQVQLFRDGIDHLERCGVARSSVNSFRAGNYGASNSTWNALAQAGLVVDSSLNLCYVGRDCRIEWSPPTIDLFRSPSGVWELPVSTFREKRGFRHLEITAISVAEMCGALSDMHRAGVGHATIVTHPAEFFVIDSVERATGRPNRINRFRLKRLLQFLDANRDRFDVRTVGALGQEITRGITPVQGVDGAIPDGLRLRRAARMGVQAIKRLDARFGRF